MIYQSTILIYSFLKLVWKAALNKRHQRRLKILRVLLHCFSLMVQQVEEVNLGGWSLGCHYGRFDISGFDCRWNTFFGSMFEDDKTPYVYVAHLPTKKCKEPPTWHQTLHIEIGSALEGSTTQEERKSFTEKIAMLEEAMYILWCVVQMCRCPLCQVMNPQSNSKTLFFKMWSF